MPDYNKGDFTQQGIDGFVEGGLHLNEKRCLTARISTDEEQAGIDSIEINIHDHLNNLDYNITGENISDGENTVVHGSLTTLDVTHDGSYIAQELGMGGFKQVNVNVLNTYPILDEITVTSIPFGNMYGYMIDGLYFFHPEVYVELDNVLYTCTCEGMTSNKIFDYVTDEDNPFRLGCFKKYPGTDLTGTGIFFTEDTEPTQHTLKIYYKDLYPWATQVLKVSRDSTISAKYTAVAALPTVHTISPRQLTTSIGGESEALIQIPASIAENYRVSGVVIKTDVDGTIQNTLGAFINNNIVNYNRTSLGSGKYFYCNACFYDWGVPVS